ncbi:MAG: hypothetical protein GC180_00085 [Bacteroidetes bacterium]|nr:hypothetical protein [Bacteroidota bacterium]
MSRAGIRIHQAAEVLRLWDPSLPFAPFFRQNCQKHKEWGSRDRREIKALCYSWFRLGQVSHLIEENESALAWAAYLYETEMHQWLTDWQAKGLLPRDLEVLDSLDARMRQFREFLNLENPFFPLADEISPALAEWNADESLAMPSRLWFRCRKDRKEELIQLLRTHKIEFTVDGLAFGMDTGINLDLILGKQASSFGAIQDRASQEVIRRIDWNGYSVWDTCTASGGKALQIMQEFTPASLFCTDVRASILENLKRRFQSAGMKIPTNGVMDLSRSQPNQAKKEYDRILCDVPCSGSGVFARNPDSMQRMNEDLLIHYLMVQEKIILHTVPFLKKGGILVYATCSVYEKENEGHFERFASIGLQLKEWSYLNYRAEGGDILFYALFEKS